MFLHKCYFHWCLWPIGRNIANRIKISRLPLIVDSCYRILIRIETLDHCFLGWSVGQFLNDLLLHHLFVGPFLTELYMLLKCFYIELSLAVRANVIRLLVGFANYAHVIFQISVVT